LFKPTQAIEQRLSARAQLPFGLVRRLPSGRRYLLGLGLPLLFALMYLYFALTTERFFTLSNTQDVLRQSATLGILAFGQAFAVLSGGVDLSVGSTVGLASVVDTLVAKAYGPWAGAAAALAAGAGVGLVNGLFVARFRVNPFIVTLGMLSVVEGIALTLTGGSYVQGMPPGFSTLGYSSLGPVPYPALIAAGAFVVALVLLTRTRFGREVYAVGGNREAARLSGLPITRVVWSIYVVVGAMAALAGVVLSSRVSSGQPELGRGMELQSVAAVVLGGVSLFGGEGSLFGVLFGVLFVSFLQNGLNLQNVSSFLQLAIIGSALIVAVTLDRIFTDRAQER
jgi:ribose transport system permease protein